MNTKNAGKWTLEHFEDMAITDSLNQIVAKPYPCCDHCGHRIRFAFHLQNSDGKEITVGANCAEKLDKSLKGQLSKSTRKMVKEYEVKLAEIEKKARLYNWNEKTTMGLVWCHKVGR